MKTWNSSGRLAAAVGLVLAATAASAAPVTISMQGTVTAFENVNLTPYGLGLGEAVNLSITFNETWSDGTYSPGDSLGPVSGNMTVGTDSYAFNNYSPWTYQGNSGNVTSVTPFFTGSGPTLGGSGQFYGMYLTMSQELAVLGMNLRFGFTTTQPDGISFVTYGYARVTPTYSSVTPATPNGVPEPTTLALAMAGVLAAGFARRKA